MERLPIARFEEAHRALLADPSVQFRLVHPPPPTPAPPWLRAVGEWLAWALRPIGRALGWIIGLLPDAPYARILFWSVIALVAAFVAWTVLERIRRGAWQWPHLSRRKIAAAAAVSDEAAPFEPEPVRAWLAEADALAAGGGFAEAAHLLLFRTVEDLARRRPGVIRPALTARELAAVAAFPPPVRARVAAIAALVERSLFGGRPVGIDEWRAVRNSYAELGRPEVWRA